MSVLTKQPHQYRDMAVESLDNIFSYFLFNSWSFSKLDAFARNEKAFEMIYIYRQQTRKSASAVAGDAYHKALDFFFSEMKQGIVQDLAAIQSVAFEAIDDVEANKWKIQKTTPTIDDCRNKANKTSVSLLEFFMGEKSVYESEIKEIIAVEVYIVEFLTINGVDIPLPCKMKIDLVIKTNEEKTVIIDHKSKAAHSDEAELKFSIGKQAITYALGYEAKTGIKVDEVWFVENKYSKNKDGSPQLNCFKMILDKDTRRLYEYRLYEPLKRMLEAIQDPDYVYLMNESDNFVDKAELNEFWAQSMMADINDFNFVPEGKKDLIAKRLNKIRDASLASIDPKTIRKFREHASEFIQYDLTNKNMTKEEKIEHVLRGFNVSVKVAHKFEGYSSDTFLLKASGGTPLAHVHRHKLDIANALNVPSIRVAKDLFVYEEQAYLAVESAKAREKDLIFDPSLLDKMKFPLGRDNFGQLVYWDLANPSTPHVLVCGGTGSGKSEFMKIILENALLAGMDEIIFLDPKHEFKGYAGGIIKVYNDIESIEEVMDDLVKKMNRIIEQGKTTKTLILFDEFADAVANARSGNELNVYEMVHIGNYKDGRKKFKREKVDTLNSLEENNRILLQKGRSVGFRIVAAAQRASVHVITGDAKVNFPVQVCFKVQKEVDSKVVIDEAGGEALTGKGDGLIRSPEYNGVIRFQSFYKPSK